MLRLTVAVAALALTVPAFAQTAQSIPTDAPMPVRSLLTQLFQKSECQFAIGPGIDGEITVSRNLLANLDLSHTVALIVSTLPYNAQYSVENGIHIVRRRPDAPTTFSPAAPTVNVAPPNISVAAPQVTFQPVMVPTYLDALKLELTHAQVRRATLLKQTMHISRDELAGLDASIAIFEKLLAQSTGKKPVARPVAVAKKR
jgi:hypothetical protein